MHNQTPFKAAWWWTDLERAGLGRIRPRTGTYGEYDCATLPELPCNLTGDFAWLRDYDPYDQHIGSDERSDGLSAIHAELREDARQKEIELPREFNSFLADSSLVQRVRTVTDCYIDLSREVLPSPVGSGSLVRFLADSQGCLFWYLYIPTCDAPSSVVVSPGFYGLPEEEWQDSPPNSSEIKLCAPSFEAFVCRLVIENEIWFTANEGLPLGAMEAEYVKRYGATI